ncbi:MAG: uridine phosphorylase [Spirochaetales bacterium]|nr:uridine phosphorylase [Spirochaetales bacterium]
MKPRYAEKHVPLLTNKFHDRPSVFSPENLMREARRQNANPAGKIPEICILDPDGDLVRKLAADKKSAQNQAWACYHTTLYSFEHQNVEYGIVGGAVGAPFAVLVAEELFVSGCKSLISVTSAGQILKKRTPPYFILIDKALRDEGTSYHYLPPAKYAHIKREFRDTHRDLQDSLTIPIEQGSTWTTDAPFREVQEAIDYARGENILAVEMEAAALYAFAEARVKDIICFALVTNQMGTETNDFEKGDGRGTTETLRLIAAVTRRWS